jgi:lycopene beta-cyclase
MVDGRDPELPEGTALFMDWRDHGVDDGGPPSFLYALSRGGRLLLEETTLASWAPVPSSVLKVRLERRLQRRGTVIDTVVAQELVEFPMGGGLPQRGQVVAAFGAALGLVSPISGYSVANTLAAVEPVADALMAARRNGARAGDAVLDAVWGAEARQRRRLQRFALRAACTFGQRAADDFFSMFFALPAPRWRGFLDGTAGVGDVRRTMLALFKAVPASLRLRLVAGAATADGLAVARDLLAGQSLIRPATRSAS